MFKSDQKGVAQLFILLILLAGIIGGVYLVQHRTNLLPKAQEANYIQIVDKDGNSITQTDDPNVYLKITLPPGWQLPPEKPTSGLVKEVFAQECSSDDPNCSPTTPASSSCPVNSSCCAQPLQTCSQNSDCPTGYQWCYKGYCISENTKNPEKGGSCVFSSIQTPAPTSNSSLNQTNHVVKWVIVENKDNDGSSGGDNKTEVIIDSERYIFNRPNPWKLNKVNPGQASADRTIQVTFAEGYSKQYQVSYKVTIKLMQLINQRSIPKLPPNDQTINMNVLVLKYFPRDFANFKKLDQKITNLDYSLDFVRQKVDALDAQAVDKLTDATRYHGYKTPAPPALNYQILEEKEFLDQLPLSYLTIDETNVKRPNYGKILNENNICDYVDNKNVSEVWVWGYHTKIIAPNESNMSMGTNARSYWNGDDYGDISNGERTNDLPICKKTYVLYNYSYERALGEMLEDHNHQIEAVMRFIDESLWKRFIEPHGETDKVNHCGWTHSPPNVTDREQYFWNSERIVQSDCEDWKPDSIGETKQISCHTWYGTKCLDNGGIEFKVWWMQNIPGLNNNLTYYLKPLRNWWEFIGDFDSAMLKGKTLYEQ